MNLIVFDIDDALTKSAYQHQLAFVKTMKEFGISEILKNSKSFIFPTGNYIVKTTCTRIGMKI